MAEVSPVNKLKVEQELTPVWMVPTATSISFMIMATRQFDCYFPLRLYLLALGSSGLACEMSSLFVRKCIDRVFSSATMTPQKAIILSGLRVMLKVLCVAQVVVLMSGLILTSMHLPSWQHTDKTKSSYCEFGPMMFTFVITTGLSGLILVAAIVYLGLKVARRKRARAASKAT